MDSDSISPAARADMERRAWLSSSASRSTHATVAIVFARLGIGALAVLIASSCADQRADPIALTPVVSAGAGYTCTVIGELRCWGDDTRGLAEPPAELRDVWSVSLGRNHACALPGYRPVCWGLNDYGQTDVPRGSPFIAVSVGEHHTCAIRDSGELVCWGSNRYGQADPPPGQYLAVSAGGYHTCALAESKRIRCWGDDSYEQSAVPSVRYHARSGSYVALSAGRWHSCAVRESGEVACWGARAPRDITDARSGTRVDFGQADPPAGKFRLVSAGATHTCGLRDSGELSCWGSETAAPAGRYTWIAAGEGLGVLRPGVAVTVAQFGSCRRANSALNTWSAGATTHTDRSMSPSDTR